MDWTNPTIRIENLSLEIPDKKVILEDFTWEFFPGRIHSLIGESGSGKTSFLLSLFGIIPPGSFLRYAQYSILNKDWKSLSEKDWFQFRGRELSLIPQNPHSAFHPYRKLGSQSMEYLKWKGKRKITPEDIRESWKEMGIRDPHTAYNSYPSQLSGGEKQRICISLADLSGAQTLVCDEPTTALDPIQEKSVMELIMETVRKKNRCLILVSHNLKLVMKVSDEVLVIRSGKMVEKNTRGESGFSPWKSDYAINLWKS